MTNERKRVFLEMDGDIVNKLDILCGVNQRSRPKLLGVMIENEHAEFISDSSRRVNPERSA